MQFCGWRAVWATSPQQGQTQWIMRIINSLGLMGSLLDCGSRHCLAANRLRIRLRLVEAAWNLIVPMDPINRIYKRGLTGAGNHGVINCQSGEATTSSTGATCDSWTWRMTLSWVVS